MADSIVFVCDVANCVQCSADERIIWIPDDAQLWREPEHVRYGPIQSVEQAIAQMRRERFRVVIEDPALQLPDGL